MESSLPKIFRPSCLVIILAIGNANFRLSFTFVLVLVLWCQFSMAQTCSDPGLQNAHLTTPLTGLPNSVVTYQCNTGYQDTEFTSLPSTSFTSKPCTLTGSYEFFPTPNCQAITCTVPSAAFYAHPAAPVNGSYQSQIIMTCNSGYQASGYAQNANFTSDPCQQNGAYTYTSTSFTCSWILPSYNSGNSDAATVAPAVIIPLVVVAIFGCVSYRLWKNRRNYKFVTTIGLTGVKVHAIPKQDVYFINPNANNNKNNQDNDTNNPPLAVKVHGAPPIPNSQSFDLPKTMPDVLPPQ